MKRFVSFLEEYGARRAEERVRLEAQGLKSGQIDAIIRENVQLNPVTDSSRGTQAAVHNDKGARVLPDGMKQDDMDPKLLEKYGLAGLDAEV